MNKAIVRVVTGYIQIAGHPRGPDAYGKLGARLRQLRAPLQSFYGAVTHTWMSAMIDTLPFAPTWSVGDNPAKNTLAYHAVTYQKFQWLYEATQLDHDADTFIWLDYGICHAPGITPEVINEFLEKIESGDFAIPGCWPRADVRDDYPCWRFCGGLFIVPRSEVQPLLNLVKVMFMLQVNATKNITWEVNTLARVELTDKLPIRWYKADHNASMFNNY